MAPHIPAKERDCRIVHIMQTPAPGTKTTLITVRPAVRPSSGTSKGRMRSFPSASRLPFGLSFMSMGALGGRRVERRSVPARNLPTGTHIVYIMRVTPDTADKPAGLAVCRKHDAGGLAGNWHYVKTTDQGREEAAMCKSCGDRFARRSGLVLSEVEARAGDFKASPRSGYQIFFHGCG